MSRLHLSEGKLRTSGGKLVLTDAQGGAPCCGCNDGQPCSPDSFPDRIYITIAGAGFCTSGTKAVRYSQSWEDAGDFNGLQPAYVVTVRHQVTTLSGGLNRTHCLERVFQGGGQARYQAVGSVASHQIRVRVDRQEVNPVDDPVRAVPGSDDFVVNSEWTPRITLRCEELATEPGRFALVVDEGEPQGVGLSRRVFPVDATLGDGLDVETRPLYLASGKPDFLLVGATYPADGANDNAAIVIDPSCPEAKGEFPPEPGCDIAVPCARSITFPLTGTRCGGQPIGISGQGLITKGGTQQAAGGSFAWDQGALADSVAGIFTNDDGSCFATSQAELYGRFLLGGSWRVHVEGECPEPAEPDPLGACCLPDGSCITTDEASCVAAGGEYGGDGVDCVDACGDPEPTGACCDGVDCTEQTELDCLFAGGTYEGDDTTCSPNPCDPVLGACCEEDGTCNETTLEECRQIRPAAVFTPGQDCLSVNCQQLGGACCRAGICTEVGSRAECDDGGRFVPGIGCNQIQCFEVEPGSGGGGACCIGGVCFLTSEPLCSANGGQWLGGRCTASTCTNVAAIQAPPGGATTAGDFF